MPDGTLVGAHHDGGVQARAPGYDAEKLVEETFFSVKSLPLLESAFYRDVVSQVGKPYDARALVDLALGSVIQRFRVSDPEEWKDPDKWFCSEMACALMERHHVLPRLREPMRRVTVRDLYMRVSGLTTPTKGV